MPNHLSQILRLWILSSTYSMSVETFNSLVITRPELPEKGMSLELDTATTGTPSLLTKLEYCMKITSNTSSYCDIFYLTIQQ